MDEGEISPIEATDSKTESEKHEGINPKEFYGFVNTLVEHGTVEAGVNALEDTITRLCGLIDLPMEGTNGISHEADTFIIAKTIIEVDRLLQKVSGAADMIAPDLQNRIYKLSEDTDVVKRHAGMLFLNAVNKIDKGREAPAHIEEHIYQRIEYALYHTEEITAEELGMLLRFVDNIPTRLVTLVYDAIGEAESDNAIFIIFSAWSNKIGLPYARMLLRTYARGHEWDQEKLDNIEQVLRINEGTFAFKTLPDLYKDINFGKEYKPNIELQKYESDLLNINLHDTKKVLDVGCGDGRLMKELKNKGRHVVGIDIVKEHLDKAKKSGEDVLLASWYETPFADKTFDGIYCLGRSFLHNITEIDQLRMLLEMNRIMQMGSALIIDLPNPERGDYAYERERMVQRSQDLGVWNIKSGFINDGPDAEHRFDRNVPDKELMVKLADTCGFKMKRVGRHEYDGQHGTNENLYWSLTKTRDLHPFMLSLLADINRKSRGVY